MVGSRAYGAGCTNPEPFGGLAQSLQASAFLQNLSGYQIFCLHLPRYGLISCLRNTFQLVIYLTQVAAPAKVFSEPGQTFTGSRMDRDVLISLG